MGPWSIFQEVGLFFFFFRSFHTVFQKGKTCQHYHQQWMNILYYLYPCQSCFLHILSLLIDCLVCYIFQFYRNKVFLALLHYILYFWLINMHYYHNQNVFLFIMELWLSLSHHYLLSLHDPWQQPLWWHSCFPIFPLGREVSVLDVFLLLSLLLF